MAIAGLSSRRRSPNLSIERKLLKKMTLEELGVLLCKPVPGNNSSIPQLDSRIFHARSFSGSSVVYSVDGRLIEQLHVLLTHSTG